jgi:hypothetical protein
MITVFITPAAVEVTVMLDGPIGVPATEVLPEAPAEMEAVPVVDPPQPARPPAVTASSTPVR